MEPHNGKTIFQIGEPIRLDLVLRNTTGSRMMVNVTDYGDNSDPVDVLPTTGWIAWQGRSGHDYRSMAQLGTEPIRIPVRVDQAAIFRQPGHYQVHVTENRVEAGADLTHLSAVQAIVTNQLEIDLEPMSEEHEVEIVRGVVADLTNATSDWAGTSLRRAAVSRLAALQGNAALDEKVKLLIAEQDDFRGVETEAWATTQDLQHQLDLIQSAWRNPQVDPAYDMPAAMMETRQLLAGRPLMGWQMVVMPKEPDPIERQLADAHRQDMMNLLESMPLRTGENRSDAAYYLVEFGGLPDAAQARARNYAVEEFEHMNDTAQRMLLETARPPLRDPRLLPALRAMLNREPADKDALPAYLALAPEQSMPYVIRAICAPQAPPPLETFAAIHQDRVPQVDACLHSLLQPQASPSSAANSVAPSKNPGMADFIWQIRVEMAARFATPALLPAIEGSGTERLAANPHDNTTAGLLLAAEARDDPPAAVARLRKSGLTQMLFYETDRVFQSAQQPFPSVVEKWLCDQLLAGADATAGQAAYQLGLAGTAQGRAAIERRLAQIRAKEADSATGGPSQAEAGLVSVLFAAQAWKLTPEERAAVIAGCVTDACRAFAKP